MIQSARIVGDYDTLIEVMRERRKTLGITCIELDAKAGFPEGYTSKLENYTRAGPGRSFGPVSMPLWLGALGLKMVIVPEADIQKL